MNDFYRCGKGLLLGLLLGACVSGGLSKSQEIEVGQYDLELKACIAKAKLGSGTVAEYRECACAVDKKYGVTTTGCPQ